MIAMHGDDVIFLLGAGASCDAGLLSSLGMTKKLEEKIGNGGPWSEYYDLYRAVKSAIVHGHIFKNPCAKVEMSLNIEEFVNVLTELARYDSHTIYPFIASWNMELVKYAGGDFKELKRFRELIITELATRWVHLQIDNNASYYGGLLRLAQEMDTHLCVFSLNYDLCVEAGCGRSNVYCGFAPESETGRLLWNDRMLLAEEGIEERIRLFKLHGSLDWREAKDGKLTCLEHPAPCEKSEQYKLIFGTSNKLRYDDPYLLLLSVFRQKVLEAKLIVCVGYSFGDEHINSMIRHSLERKEETRIISVTYNQNKEGEVRYASDIASMFGVKHDRVTVCGEGAKTFFEKVLGLEFMEMNMPKPEAPF